MGLSGLLWLLGVLLILALGGCSPRPILNQDLLPVTSVASLDGFQEKWAFNDPYRRWDPPRWFAQIEQGERLNLESEESLEELFGNDLGDDPFGLLEYETQTDEQPGQLTTPDPLLILNRYLFAFFRAIDLIFIRPYTTMVYEALPTVISERIIDFTNVLDMPSSAVQLLLQGQPRLAFRRLGRFIASVASSGGLIDVERHRGYLSEDLGQTLAAKFDVPPGFYIATPYGFPSNVRDLSTFFVQNLVGGGAWFIHQDPLVYSAFLLGLGSPFTILQISLLLFERGYSNSSVEYVETSLDPYSAYRDIVTQRRLYLIDEQDGEFISRRSLPITTFPAYPQDANMPPSP